jgi:predicted GIY-YIG superfamily endonuclease
VYAIHDSTRWIYIGETNDIRRRLLEHLSDAGSCILRQYPTSFSFEEWIESLRVGRQNQLISELRPVCNQMLG